MLRSMGWTGGRWRGEERLLAVRWSGGTLRMGWKLYGYLTANVVSGWYVWGDLCWTRACPFSVEFCLRWETLFSGDDQRGPSLARRHHEDLVSWAFGVEKTKAGRVGARISGAQQQWHFQLLFLETRSGTAECGLVVKSSARCVQSWGSGNSIPTSQQQPEDAGNLLEARDSSWSRIFIGRGVRGEVQ
jgi:hypothetical protein